MKLLAAVLSLLLLAGCAAPQAADVLPTQPAAQALHVPGHTLETQTSGIVQVFPTGSDERATLYALEDSLLLRSGSCLTQLTGSRLLPGDTLPDYTPVYCGSQGLWLYDSQSRRVHIYAQTLEETETFSLPEATIGTPAVGEEEELLYFLQPDGLYVLERSTGITRPLRCNLSLSGGSIRCLSRELLLVQLLDTHAATTTLLLSTRDGSTRYPDYTPRTAAWCREGLLLQTDQSPFPKILLFRDPDAVFQLETGPMEQLVGFCPEISAAITWEAPAGEDPVARIYDLSSGTLESRVTLPGIDTLEPGCVTRDGTVYVLAHSREDRQWYILRWNYTAFPAEETGLLSPCTPEPEAAQIASCQATAARLSVQYGLEIRLFQQAAQQQPWDYSLTATTQAEGTAWALEAVEEVLAAFPEGFLETLQAGWESFSLCLVDSIQGTAQSGSLAHAQGLQFQQENAYYIALALATPEQLRYTLFHEFSHLIDTQVMNHTDAYDTWNDFNPQDFAYPLDATGDVSQYSSLLSGENRCFVDAYAMTTPAEDRARIFECAANPGNEELFSAPVLQAKLLRMCLAIRETFGLTQDENAYLWEAYLTAPVRAYY